MQAGNEEVVDDFFVARLFFLTSSLKKHKFHNCLATIVLYLCVT